MGSMTDERRKEMEEEMMRFELEIAAPGDEMPAKKVKPLPPPPMPGLAKLVQVPDAKKPKLAPPPPPPQAPRIVEILPTVLKPPPPPPPPGGNDLNKQMMRPQMPTLHPPRIANMQFIPHQVRQPPRPPMMQMRGPPGFHGPGPMHFPPMQNSLPPPPPQMAMPMPPMGMPMHMPPAFCPPPPGIGLGPPQSFVQPMQAAPMTFSEQAPPAKQDAPPAKKLKMESATTAAPVMYAAPPIKNLSEKASESTSITNGQTESSSITSAHQSQQPEEPKATEEPVVTAATTIAITSSSGISTASSEAASKKEKKKKKIIRMAGGQAWEDNSLMDWDPDDFRIFCGDLGNDVTDEVLIRAFSKYPSFVRAKVIRDKRTNKTKGYGFVSFKDPQDFIKAMREMNGRYVGSRPIKLRKSTWRDRNIEIVRKKQKEKEKLGLL